MIRRSLPLLLAALIAPALAVPAQAAQQRKRVAKPAPVARPAAPSFHQAPARMIEVAPGRWISSWGCYTDEGYGRVGSCDMREGHR